MIREIAQRLKNISTAVGRIPSMGYALIYLLCIPIFALAYTSMPNNFYHSTVQFEKSLDKDAQVILHKIKNEIIAGFKEAHGDYIASDGNWKIWISNIDVHSLKPEESQTKFSIHFKLFGINKLQGVESGVTASVLLETKPTIGTLFGNKGEMRFYKKITIEYPKSFVVEPSFIFPLTFKTNQRSKNKNRKETWFPMTLDLNNEIIAFYKATKGFPIKASGSFSRMFYFSAVTITTLGYGDIVPISNTSRILVSLESILGIVLIGLFLNSLSSEHKAK